MTQISYFFSLLKSHRFHRFTQIFSFTFLPFKVTQIAQMTQIFYPLKVPQISQIHTDFFFYFFTFKSHADCADDADFLPLKFPRRRSHPAKYGEGNKRAVPKRSQPAKHGEGKKRAVPRRSHPAKHGEGFDAPPTLERSGSEHRRAVTSFPSEKGRLG